MLDNDLLCAQHATSCAKEADGEEGEGSLFSSYQPLGVSKLAHAQLITNIYLGGDADCEENQDDGQSPILGGYCNSHTPKD